VQLNSIYKDIVNQPAIGIVIINPNREIRKINPYLLQLFGYNEDELNRKLEEINFLNKQLVIQ